MATREAMGLSGWQPFFHTPQEDQIRINKKSPLHISSINHTLNTLGKNSKGGEYLQMMVESTDNAARSQWGYILRFKLNLTQDQSTQNNKDLKQSVCTSGPNLAIQAWMAHMFSRRQARNGCTNTQTDTGTEVGNEKLASGKNTRKY